jgi:hypothetical protein
VTFLSLLYFPKLESLFIFVPVRVVTGQLETNLSMRTCLATDDPISSTTVTATWSSVVAAAAAGEKIITRTKAAATTIRRGRWKVR